MSSALLSSDLPSVREGERSCHFSRVYHIPDIVVHTLPSSSHPILTTMLCIRYESPYFIDQEMGIEGRWLANTTELVNKKNLCFKALAAHFSSKMTKMHILVFSLQPSKISGYIKEAFGLAQVGFYLFCCCCCLSKV